MAYYTLTHSKRKTAALYIRNGGVEVRAPLSMPKSDIDKFVESKEKWIRDRLAKSKAQAERRQNFTLTYGDYITCIGKRYLIAAMNGSYTGFDGKQFYIPPNLTPEQIKRICIHTYRVLAKRDLTNKVFDFAKQMSVIPTAVRITGAKTRWGSCSGKKSLNFSWRLIMADHDVIDYVVVHELAHITEMNHSDRFWAIVKGVFPDYKERQMRLKELQRRLCGENWDS